MQMCTSVPRAIYEKEPRTSRGTCSSDRASIACHIGILRRRSFRNQSTHPREAIQDRFWASRSEEHTSELQSHSFISYAVFCLKKKTYTSILFLRFASFYARPSRPRSCNS